MQDKYCGDCYDIYSIQSLYKGAAFAVEAMRACAQGGSGRPCPLGAGSGEASPPEGSKGGLGGRQAPQLLEIFLHNLTFLVQIFGTIGYIKASIVLSSKHYLSLEVSPCRRPNFLRKNQDALD